MMKVVTEEMVLLFNKRNADAQKEIEFRLRVFLVLHKVSF